MYEGLVRVKKNNWLINDSHLKKGNDVNIYPPLTLRLCFSWLRCCHAVLSEVMHKKGRQTALGPSSFPNLKEI